MSLQLPKTEIHLLKVVGKRKVDVKNALLDMKIDLKKNLSYWRYLNA
jgi:hypothetical protein